MGAANLGGRSKGAELFAVTCEPANEAPVELLAALSQALYDVAELIALACVAPVTLEAERRVRTARAHRAATRRAA